MEERKKIMIDYAMKYLERGFTPIPLYSPSLLEKGIAPKWYEEKRKEIVQPTSVQKRILK